MLHPSDFFDLSDESVAAFFADCDLVWQALPHIGRHVARLTGTSKFSWEKSRLPRPLAISPSI